MMTRKYYQEIVDEFEKVSEKKEGYGFDHTIKEDLINFLDWLDKERIAVWKD